MVELDRGDMEQYLNFHTEHNEKEKESVWTTFVSWDKLLLVLITISLLSALAALFVLVTPLLDFALDFMGLHYAGWNQWESWILGADRGLFVVAALGLNALVFALLARYRVRRNWSVYAEAGCPQCHEHELTRVRRNHRDRSLSFLGVPVRRYSCRNCTWHGVRLAGYRYSRPAGEIEERDAGAFESQAGLFEEAVDAVELSTASIPAATMKVTDVSLENSMAIGSVELADQPFEFDEPGLIENSVDEEGMASLMFVDETGEDTELDDDSANEEAKSELLESLIVREPGVEEDEDQSDTHEKMTNSEAESEIDDEDDEFARLCLEVAQSKQ